MKWSYAFWAQEGNLHLEEIEERPERPQEEILDKAVRTLDAIVNE